MLFFDQKKKKANAIRKLLVSGYTSTTVFGEYIFTPLTIVYTIKYQEELYQQRAFDLLRNPYTWG